MSVPAGIAPLDVVGAGLGRTGTHSLKLALERLTGRRCYHMIELFDRVPDTAVWRDAAAGRMPDWREFLRDFGATLDWPACGFWREIATANPEAVVVLSVRDDAETWWRSFEATIATTLSTPVPEGRPEWAERRQMTLAVLAETFTPDWADRDAAIAAYEAHNAAVRAAVPAGRLVEWRPADGWEPLSRALGIGVPDEPFPRTNTTADFQAEAAADIGQ